jgi:16S rRNA A1518/A1519 N6-dimethyltransferase RsmA/KsgA/DIM1 with predicted DNA glycosylase/AP lyase activity
LKRRRLGQHYLVDPEVVRSIVDAAQIGSSDKIIEIGTGRGALTRELAELGTRFEGYEIDRQNFEATLEAVEGTKAQIHLTDPFKESPAFDVLVSSLPYSESSTFVEWLSRIDFRRAVVVLQDDFIAKIMAPAGDRNYRGISALAQISSHMQTIAKVSRRSFSPPPRVNSSIVCFTPKMRVSKDEASSVFRLFSLRRRQVDSALAELGMASGRSFGRRRVYSLTPSEVHDLCVPSKPP